MDRLHEGRHVGEILFANQRMIGSGSTPLPAVVDINIGPAVLAQSGRDHRLRILENLILVDGYRIAIPATPTHRGG